MPIPPPIQKQINEELFRNLVTLLLSDRAADRTVNAVSDTEVDISDKTGNAVKVTLDPATGMLTKVSYRMMGPQGPSQVENVYKDWRDVGGFKAPFAIEIMQGGQKSSEIKFETITVNTGVKLEEIMK
jgi:hypothetical protein